MINRAGEEDGEELFCDIEERLTVIGAAKDTLMMNKNAQAIKNTKYLKHTFMELPFLSFYKPMIKN